MADDTTREQGDLSAVRVVIADDHPIWRSGVRSDLGENFHVVGEAGDADEAIEVINATSPDLVLSDLHMPNGGGLKVAKECGEMTNVVMLTVSEAERDLLDAVAAGLTRLLGVAIAAGLTRLLGLGVLLLAATQARAHGAVGLALGGEVDDRRVGVLAVDAEGQLEGQREQVSEEDPGVEIAPFDEAVHHR